MPRIPDADLNAWKQAADLVGLMRDDGMEFKRSGKDQVCRCPFHEDERPSLRVTPKAKGGPDLWNCPACHTGGDALQWLMKFRKLSFRAAVELLRERAGATAPALSGSAGLPCPLSPDMDKAQMLAATLAYYHERLTDEATGAACREYLASRGLDDGHLIRRFNLGYADRTLGLRLPPAQVKAGLAIRTRLIEAGLWRGSGHEHLNGCLVVPIRDGLDVGRIEPRPAVRAYGRILNPDPRRNDGAKHLYLPGPHHGVLNPDAYEIAGNKSGGSGHLVLCEAPLDALTLYAHGIEHVCCTWGTQGFTADHLAAMKRAQVKEVRLAFDRDEAGDLGAAHVAEVLKREGIACYRVELPHGLDVNAYAMGFQDKEDRIEALAQAVRAASFMHGNGAAAAPPHVAPAAAVPSPPVPPPATTPAQVAPAGWSIEHAQGYGEVLATVAGERIYRVRGLPANTGPERLKVSVKVWRKSNPTAMHADSLDLSQARARAAFIAETAREVGESDGVIKGDIARLFGELEAMRDALIAEREQPKAQTCAADLMGEADKAQALALLRSPDLLARIVFDFAACGVVGEETNKLVGYLAATSRLLPRPLAIVVQSSSAAGKTSLLDAVLAMMPDEAQVRYSAMTGQSLYYMGGESLKHKILAIAEEEGAEQASYSLKLLQSEGKLAIATPSKDAQGQIKTERYEVEGPAAIFLTTTAADVDEELLNRCLVLTVDEDREQTRRIHEQQRKAETLEGLQAQMERSRLLRLHQNAQRLLESVKVVNPFAERLTFLDGKTRARRDHPKYLALIRTLALLHQHQRKRHEHTDKGTGEIVQYIEASREDIAAANRLMGEVLGRSLDELPPQTRRLLGQIESMVAQACAAKGVKRTEHLFTRREVREFTGWGNTQTKTHMQRLEEMEYLAVRRRGSLMLYELVYDHGQAQASGGKHLPGLLDPENLHYDGDRSGVNGEKSAPGRPQVGPVSGGGRGGKVAPIAGKTSQIQSSGEANHGNGDKGPSSANAVVGGVVDGEGEAPSGSRAFFKEAAESAAENQATEEKTGGGAGGEVAA